MKAAFDLRALLLARHAQHVVLIHFPIALFMTGCMFDAWAARKRDRVLASVAYYNLLMAALTAVPAFITGIIAWQLALEGAALKGVLLLHLIFGVTLTLLMLLVAWVHLRARRAQSTPPAWRFPVEVFGFALLAVTAHLGGFLSGVNG